MVDYEQVFSMTLQQRLKTRIIGKIYVEVNKHDQLFVKINGDGEHKFEMHLDNFSDRMLNGWSTSYAAYEVIQEYKKFLIGIMEEQYFYQDERER